MLFSVQRLVTRSLINRRTSITAIHDALLSWSGLGSAIVQSYRQWELPASPLHVAMAGAYLAGIAIFHISNPSLFSLNLYNDTIIEDMIMFHVPDPDFELVTFQQV